MEKLKQQMKERRKRTLKEQSWINFLTKKRFSFMVTLTANFPIWEKQLKEKVENYFRAILAVAPRTKSGEYKTVTEFFYVLERNPSLDGYHVHGLLKAPAGVDDVLLDKLWQNVMNSSGKSNMEHRTDIKKPRSIRKVADYIVKDIEKDYAEYDFLSSLMREFRVRRNAKRVKSI
jgi:hypothetical protein